MTVIYFSQRDYREAMRDPYNSSRSHAICRRLLGVPASYPDHVIAGRSALSVWYGAHYYAACAVTRNPEGRGLVDDLEFYRKCFAREINSNGNCDPPIEAKYRALWGLAVKRVLAIREEALALSHSMLW